MSLSSAGSKVPFIFATTPCCNGNQNSFDVSVANSAARFSQTIRPAVFYCFFIVFFIVFFFFFGYLWDGMVGAEGFEDPWKIGWRVQIGKVARVVAGNMERLRPSPREKIVGGTTQLALQSVENGACGSKKGPQTFTYSPRKTRSTRHMHGASRAYHAAEVPGREIAGSQATPTAAPTKHTH
jgi:hypothetical protein